MRKLPDCVPVGNNSPEPELVPKIPLSMPQHGFQVQGWAADDGSEKAPETYDYESMTCHACGGVHLINPKTGRMLGAGWKTNNGGVWRT
jgi:hypothetical protein